MPLLRSMSLIYEDGTEAGSRGRQRLGRESRGSKGALRWRIGDLVDIQTEV